MGGPDQINQTVSPASTNCVGTTIGRSLSGVARGDQVTEGMGLEEGAPLVFAEGGVDRGDEHRLSLAPPAGPGPDPDQPGPAAGPAVALQSATSPNSSTDSALWRL